MKFSIMELETNILSCNKLQNISNREIFVIGCYPSDDIRIDLLKKQIDIIRRYSDNHIMIVSHFPIPLTIQESVEYVLYDGDNRLGDDVAFTFNYYFNNGNLSILSKILAKNYHAPSILTNMKNALQFCLKRYEVIHYIESDFFFYIDKYLKKCREQLNNGKKFFGFFSDFDDDIDGGLMSFNVEWMNNKIKKAYTWEDYKKIDHDMKKTEEDPGNLIFEPWFYRYFEKFEMLEESVILSNKKEYIIINNACNSLSGDRIFVSEVDDGNLILFITRDIEPRSNFEKEYKVEDTLNDKIIAEGKIEQSHVIWYIIPKKNMVIDFYVNKELIDTIVIHKDYIYNDTVFLFKDLDIKCVSWFGDFREDGVKFEAQYALRKIDKLMIVAHPDDESIFGGNALLNEKGWKVVCVTCGYNKIRKKEFERAMAMVGVDSFEMWNFKDSLNESLEIPEIIDKIDKVIKEKKYRKIITHNQEGEYGHTQHINLYNIIKNLNVDNLYVFNASSNKLSKKEIENKINLLKIYKSQATIKDLGIPCLPSYENYVFNENIILSIK